MGQRWHRTSRRIYIFLWIGNENHELGYVRHVMSGQKLRRQILLVIGCHT
jgi:hypothetical protein